VSIHIDHNICSTPTSSIYSRLLQET